MSFVTSSVSITIVSTISSPQWSIARATTVLLETFPLLPTTSVSSISSSQSQSSLTSSLLNGSGSTIDDSHLQPSSTYSATSYPNLVSTPITSTPTPTPNGSHSEGTKAGIAVGVVITALLVIGSVYLIWRRRNHRKNGRVNSIEEPGLILTSPEVVERPHELDGEGIPELDSSMIYQPAEIDGTAAATISNQGNVQNSVIVPKSDQLTPTLPEAIFEKSGIETRNSSRSQRSPGREAKTQAEMDEIDRLEKEKSRIDEMYAERLKELRMESSAIQDRIRQAKEGSARR